MGQRQPFSIGPPKPPVRFPPTAADFRTIKDGPRRPRCGPSACVPGYTRLRSGSRRLCRERFIEQHLRARTERLGQRCRDERGLRIHITGDIVVERRGQISLQLRVSASYLGMVAQIVTKQKAALPPGMVSLQNMEVVCPWPGKSLPEEKLSWQPGLVLRHVSITQRLK